MHSTLIKKVEGKTVQEESTKKEVAAPGKGVIAYFGDIKEEFRKISWTSAEELKVYTKIVVGATLVFGMGIYIADLGIQSILRGLNNIVQWIAG